jgi:hypothetical protein
MYMSLNFIGMVKSRRMRWTGRVARMASVETSESKRPLGD